MKSERDHDDDAGDRHERDIRNTQLTAEEAKPVSPPADERSSGTRPDWNPQSSSAAFWRK